MSANFRPEDRQVRQSSDQTRLLSDLRGSNPLASSAGPVGRPEQEEENR